MRVVGLISGGKDSVWNLHYCRHFGHELVCAAHLAPPEGVDELDSYMYQTVGSSVVGAIADALGLPLVCRTILGKPRSTSSQAYEPAADGEGQAEAGPDEVEDLTALLQDVLRAHPDVQAVSCGAILSNYQRLRVENVCGRLGLKVLAFMWKQEQTRLLRQMIEARLDARLVKVASMGLNRKHVGESILNPAFADHVFQLGDKWGVHVCGEGGEYETTVVDAPLFRGRLRFEGAETVDHQDGGDDVAFLRVPRVALDAKLEAAAGPPFKVLAPYSSLRYYQETFPALPSSASTCSAAPSPRCSAAGVQKQRREPELRRLGSALVATGSLDVWAFGLSPDGTPESQCESLLHAVAAWLQRVRPHGRGLRDAVFSEVQVRDLGCFEAVNAVYGRYFAVEPPPRICIQTPLPEGVHLRLRLLLQAEPEVEVERLRVQSISTWAMACIGPYSQAAWAGGALLSAGVLGLVPHSMALPTADAARVAVETVPEEDAEGAEASSSPTPTALHHDWEAELWMLMRSMSHVLQELRSSLSAACFVQVYLAVGLEEHASDVCSTTLAYIQRERSSAAPLLACASVPRLPRGGLVEVAVVCGPADGGDAGPLAAEAEARLSDAGGEGAIFPLLQGSVSVDSRPGAGAITAVATSELSLGAGAEQEVSEDAIRWAAKMCMQALWKELERRCSGRPFSASLLAQYAVEGAQETVEAAVTAGVQDAGAGDDCVLAYMPVAALPPRGLLRITALASVA